jgi:hypothetical protein
MKSVWRAIVITLVVCLSARAARAQEPVDDRFRADIKKLLDATGTKALGLQMANLVANSVLENMRSTTPNMPERAVEIVRDVLNAEFAKAFDGPMIDEMVPLYAKHFTHAEVLALLDFYSSDLGRKVVGELPILAQEGAQVGQRWAQRNLPAVLQTLEQRLRAEQIIP